MIDAIIKDKILNSNFPEEVFGENIDHDFRTIAKAIHPDQNPDDSESTDLFSKLLEWKIKANRKKSLGLWGQTHLSINSPFIGKIISGKEIKVEIARNNVFTIFLGSDNTVIQIPNHPKDNDLIERGFRNIEIIRKGLTKSGINNPFLPSLLELTSINTNNNKRLQIGIYGISGKRPITLESLAKYSNKFDKTHYYWIYRRVLLALDGCHRSGYCHNNIHESSILVYPSLRGITLLDWSNSCLISRKHPYYHPLIEYNTPLSSVQKDLEQLKETMIKVSNDDIIKEFNPLVKTAINSYDEFLIHLKKNGIPGKYIPMEDI